MEFNVLNPFEPRPTVCCKQLTLGPLDIEFQQVDIVDCKFAKNLIYRYGGHLTDALAANFLRHIISPWSPASIGNSDPPMIGPKCRLHENHIRQTRTVLLEYFEIIFDFRLNC